jgi:pimeloyl-ACP methyl ester carboxylesterase
LNAALLLLLFAADKAGNYAQVHGLKMYYESHGQGPPLVVLHPATATIDYWPQAMEYFSKSYRVIAPEQIGHGHTADDPKRPLTYHAMAEDTAELLQQLKVESAYLLGWSDGGIVALDLAIHHPTLVKKLAASGANMRPLRAESELGQWIKSVKAVCGPKDKPGENCWPPMWSDAYKKVAPDPSHWPAFLDRMKTMFLTEPNLSKQELGGIKSPALIIAGDHDLIELQETSEIFGSIPGAQLWIVPGSGHFVPKERAALFNETVDRFFKETPAPQH